MVSRRRFVRSCLAGTLLTGAGCTSRRDATSETLFLCGLELSNSDDTPHDISLTILHDDTSIFNRSFSLTAMKNHTQGGGKIDHDWPDEPGVYTVSASLASGQKHQWDLSELYPKETIAVSIEVEIIDDGSLELWYTKSACNER